MWMGLWIVTNDSIDIKTNPSVHHIDIIVSRFCAIRPH